MPKKAATRPRQRAIPATMRAATIDRFGEPEVLTLHRVPVPSPGPDEVLIALHTAGIGVWDAHERRGDYAKGGERFPVILGSDGAGTVVATGARVRRLRNGDRVWGYAYDNPNGGWYAEFVAVNAAAVGRVPKRLDLAQAGAGAVTALTASQGVDDQLHLRRGQTVLVLGASGAVGTLGVQFARWRGAKVIATATGRRAATLVRRLGAAAVIDVRRAGAVDALRTLAPDGLDAILALAGGESLERCIDLVRPGGRVAYPSGIAPVPQERDSVHVISYDAVAGPQEFLRLARASTAARLRVPIAAVYPLSQAARAHARVEKGGQLGRVVLRIETRR